MVLATRYFSMRAITGIVWALALGCICHAASSPEWTAAAAFPESGFTSIVSGETGYAAVDDTGAFWTSADTFTWTRGSAKAANPIRTLRFSRGAYFAFPVRGTGRPPLLSSDGISWTELPAGNGIGAAQDLTDLVWWRGRYVAIGFDTEQSRMISASSVDGRQWQVSRSEIKSVPSRMATDGERLVAIAGAVALVSDDGVKWQEHAVTANALPLVDLAWGNESFVVVAEGNADVVAPPGTVSIAPGPIDPPPPLIQNVFASRDGQVWTARAAMPSPVGVVFSEDRFIAVGVRQTTSAKTAVALDSSDTVAWHETAQTLNYPSGTALTVVAAVRNGALVSGPSRVLLQSHPASGWSRLDGGVPYMIAPCYARGAFWATTTNGMLCSVDGRHWQRYPLQMMQDPSASGIAVINGFMWAPSLLDLTFTGTAFVGLTGTTLGDTHALRSENGLVWTDASVPVGYYNGIASGDGRIVAVGDSGKIAVSRDDGLTWTTGKTGRGANFNDEQLRNVGCGNGLIVATSNYTSFASLDGLQWRSAPLPPHSFSSPIKFYEGRFYRVGGETASGRGMVQRTTNGLDWQNVLGSIDGCDRFNNTSDLVQGPDGLYASVEAYYGNRPEYLLIYSRDGESWQVLSRTGLQPFAYGGGVFVAVTALATRGFFFPATAIYTARVGAASQLMNLSCLGGVGPHALTLGLTIEGADGREILFRTSGPGLRRWGITDSVQNPIIQLFDATGTGIGTNSPSLLPLLVAETPDVAAARVGAFPQTPGDQAKLLRLRPGAYSMQAAATGAESGRMLAELYDAQPMGVNDSSIRNFSVRSLVRPNQPATLGFVVRGSSPLPVLIRCAGPALARFGVQSPAPDPEFVLRDERGAAISANDNWNDNGDAVGIRLLGSHAGAFAFAEASKDAAVALSLSPGAYTLEVRDRSNQGGDVLTEIFAKP